MITGNDRFRAVIESNPIIRAERNVLPQAARPQYIVFRTRHAPLFGQMLANRRKWGMVRDFAQGIGKLFQVGIRRARRFRRDVEQKVANDNEPPVARSAAKRANPYWRKRIVAEKRIGAIRGTRVAQAVERNGSDLGSLGVRLLLDRFDDIFAEGCRIRALKNLIESRGWNDNRRRRGGPSRERRRKNILCGGRVRQSREAQNTHAYERESVHVASKVPAGSKLDFYAERFK